MFIEVTYKKNVIKQYHLRRDGEDHQCFFLFALSVIYLSQKLNNFVSYREYTYRMYCKRQMLPKSEGTDNNTVDNKYAKPTYL